MSNEFERHDRRMRYHRHARSNSSGFQIRITIGTVHMAKPKKNLTSAQRRAKRERKKKFMMVFVNGKQKRVPRPQLIEGLPVDEFIARNADPVWLHQMGMWEYITPDMFDQPFEEDDERGIFPSDSVSL